MFVVKFKLSKPDMVSIHFRNEYAGLKLEIVSKTLCNYLSSCYLGDKVYYGMGDA